MDATLIRAGSVVEAAQYCESLGARVVAARSYRGFTTVEVEDLDDRAMAAVALAEAAGEVMLAKHL